MKSRKLQKRALLFVLALGVSFAASAVINRPYETEYTYFDANGNWVGSLTVPCTGRLIREGNTTDYAFFTQTSFSCDIGGPEPEPNFPPFPGPFG